MLKKIVIAVVALGFAWSVPSFRGRVTTFLAPALDVLGPVGYRMQEPMREYKADTDLKFLADQLQIDQTYGRPLPSGGQAFSDWMLKRKGAGDRGKDPWGNLYWMDRSGGGILLGSNGRDGERGTPDDQTKLATLKGS